MNNNLKGILAGAFALIIALLLLSKCTSCRQQPEVAQAVPEQPAPQTPPQIIDEEPLPEDTVEAPVDTVVPEPEPEPQPAPEPEPEPEPVEVRTDEGQDGEIRVTIEWAWPGDVDLHVIEPSGNEISFRNMSNGRTGAQLDVDNRQGGTRANTAVENVFWSNPDQGRYQVFIVMYNMSSDWPQGGPVNVRIKNGSDVRTYTAYLTTGGQRANIDTFNYRGR